MILSELEFDEEFYFTHNPDVRHAMKKGLIKSAFQHYQSNGIKERRPARKMIDQNFLKRGFSSSMDRIRFYTMVQHENFIQMIQADDFKQALNIELADYSPKIILENLE